MGVGVVGGIHRNCRNALLAALLPLPSIAFYAAFLSNYCSSRRHHSSSSSSSNTPTATATATSTWDRVVCHWSSAQHPLALLNLLFFLNVDLLFWLISLFQRSTWLIDPYWTFLPLFMAHFYALHPRSKSDPIRSRVVIALTWVWSIRLTHSYFRREKWQWGEREDWRFAQMRDKYPKHWWWISFFYVYVSQQCFLVGICLPIYAVHNSSIEWGILDFFVSFVCILGIAIGYVSDTQLYNFVEKNRILKQLGAPPIPVLDNGLWYYSRHPNYFGEQLWWWGLAGYSWIVGQSWVTIGTIINSAIMAQVTVLVEERMVANASRSEAYAKYQQTTSVWIPLPKHVPKPKRVKSS